MSKVQLHLAMKNFIVGSAIPPFSIYPPLTPSAETPHNSENPVSNVVSVCTKNVKYFLALVTKQIIVMPAWQQKMVGQDDPRVYHHKQCRMLVLPKSLYSVPDPREGGGRIEKPV